MTATASPQEFLALQAALSGRYTLERELGRGGMGAVFLARDIALERAVAIKLLLPHLAYDEEQRERFVREARTAAQLMHPNIVPIHAVEVQGDLVFFVMAYIDGETLTQRVERKGTLSPTEARQIMRDVAWALAFAHGRGVVHRDIKPDNILIEHSSGRAMVADFGIARVASVEARSEDGALVGTVQYMSPEQASAEPLDGRSDVYSLGASMYFSLVGRSPVQAPSFQAALTRLLTEASPNTLTERPDLPSDFALTLSRSMARDLSARASSAESLAAELQEQERSQPPIRPEVRWFLAQASQAKTVTMFGVLGIGLAAAFRFFGMIGAEGAGIIAVVSGTVAIIGPASVVINLIGVKRQGVRRNEVARGLEHEFAEIREAFRAQQARFDATRWKRETGAIWLASGGFFLVNSVADLLRGARFFGVNVLGSVVGAIFSAAGLVLLSGIGSSSRFVQGMVARAAAVPQRADLFSRLLYRAVKSRPAQWLFGEAGNAKLDSALAPTPTLLLERVDALLAELPRDVATRLSGLRPVASMLERAGSALRTQIAGLDRALAEQPESQLADELRRRRARAAQRLADCTTALETLRTDLLRLSVGEGGPDGLTLALEKARELGAAIDAELHGQSEVQNLLRGQT